MDFPTITVNGRSRGNRKSRADYRRPTHFAIVTLGCANGLSASHCKACGDPLPRTKREIEQIDAELVLAQQRELEAEIQCRIRAGLHGRVRIETN
jgi:hypothetical protein